MTMNRIESNGTNELRGIYEHYRLHEKAFLFLLHVSYEEAYEQHPDWFTNCVLLDLTCEQLVTFVEAARVTAYSLCADQIQGFRSDDQFVLQNKSNRVKAIYCCINEKRSQIPYFVDKICALIRYTFTLKDILHIETHYFFVFTQTGAAQNMLSALLVQGGIGDIFIQIPIMHYLLNQKPADTRMIFVDDCSRIPILHTFLENSRVIPISELNITFKCLTKLIVNLHCIISELHKVPKEFIAALSYEQSMFENICYQSIDDKRESLPRYVFQTFLNMSARQTLPPIPEWGLISQKHKTVICLQRISSLDKEWPLEQARRFIMECHKHRIAVINIAPDETEKDLYDYDFSIYPIQLIISLLKQADAFVGIDSCFGHACALIQKNSLTLFQSKIEHFQKLSLAFLPVSKNYSIIPRDYACKAIPYAQAFDCLYKILNGSIQTHQGFLGFHERKENIDYEWS